MVLMYSLCCLAVCCLVLCVSFPTDDSWEEQSLVQTAAAGCPCVNPRWPCFTARKTCNSIKDKAFCESRGGQLCEFAECTVPNCKRCNQDGTECKECKEGFFGATCEDKAKYFEDNQFGTGLGGLITLASPKIHEVLASGFAASNTYQGTRLASEAFLNKFGRDVVDLVVVYPSAKLPGRVNQQVSQC